MAPWDLGTRCFKSRHQVPHPAPSGVYWWYLTRVPVVTTHQGGVLPSNLADTSQSWSSHRGGGLKAGTLKGTWVPPGYLPKSRHQVPHPAPLGRCWVPPNRYPKAISMDPETPTSGISFNAQKQITFPQHS
ncbi:uncharacterized protein PGTG_03143 [Puccinia graminis f. sp. tritici CRL 75-36-700-3]|uniref:Uncharacterized protein n=1 Tax=Puccinia graminis f. sp. tritici (strain CRL 75-36-700-3 / race SCCL) TaxID=418459 RepID=E3JYR2_PUCGT|nr:uncharacterized protein PGTG_03143 [Puccinia graminis f. sp. tritici CRL 75-36-700-3]EFP77187.1 hypothetical protein PGTG_03143 [Puccinia graminis f. sp. tritici CRL 75-36-700-3]